MRHGALLILILFPAAAHAAGAGVVGENLLWLALILLSARLFHGSDFLAPVKPGERERLRPLKDRLHELGLKPRSW